MIGLWWAAAAEATWSVVAVDPDSREVGVAGATCGPFVWMIGEVAPGHGAVAAQYATNLAAEREAADLLAAGTPPDEVLAAITDPAFDEEPEIRQYGIASLDGPAVAYTGADNDSPALSATGDTWTVQGNTLASEAVVTEAAAAFEASEGQPLAERLLRAMEAGAAAGGDARCDPEQAAKSAFVFVARPGDRPGNPWLEARTSSVLNGDDPVDRLREEVERKLDRSGCATGPGSAVAAALGLLAARRRRTDPR
ncbi:MAG: DUF1028 domain-containing protein [Myxococcota bacterium]